MSFKKDLGSKLFFVGLCLIVVGVIILLNKKVEIFNAPTPMLTPAPISYAKVVRVYDGDTIEIDTGQKVRYIGVDSAEIHPTFQCFSKEAKKENESLVLEKEIKLVKDTSETDKYGRLLRYVYVGNVLVNDYMVRNGYAKVMTVPPDIKYVNQFLELEKIARENNLGLWKICP